MNSIEEKVNCVLWFAELQSAHAVRQKFVSHYFRSAPPENLIEEWMTRFKETGSINEISTEETFTPKFDNLGILQELITRTHEENIKKLQMERLRLLARAAAEVSNGEYTGTAPESPETEKSLDSDNFITPSSSMIETASGDATSYTAFDLPRRFVSRSSDRDPAEYPFKCEHCSNSFRHKRNLNTHYKVHTGEKPFECKVCQARFTAKLSMTQHLKIHTGEKPYKCTECEYRARAKSSLIKHARIHTGEKPYQCKLCGLCFRQKGALVNHGRIHTGERPYKCEVCGSCFRRKKTLVHHSRIHQQQPLQVDQKPDAPMVQDSV